MLSFDVALPDNDTPFRFLKFLPLSSKYTDGIYKVGLRELEYFVAEVEPATPTEVNAAFTRPWTYIAQGNISNYPDYKEYAAVTDGNWLFVVASRQPNTVSTAQYFCVAPGRCGTARETEEKGRRI